MFMQSVRNCFFLNKGIEGYSNVSMNIRAIDFRFPYRDSILVHRPT